jgi:hypothetical protein
MKSLIPMIFALACAPLLALAEDAPVDSLAPAACKRPAVSAKIRKADDDTDFQERAEAYKKCINDYVAMQSDLAQRHQNAANAAIADFNAFAKDVNTRESNSGK